MVEAQCYLWMGCLAYRMVDSGCQNSNILSGLFILLGAIHDGIKDGVVQLCVCQVVWKRILTRKW